MVDPERGTWWGVRSAGARIEISHGPSVDGQPLETHAIVLVGLAAALELAVGIVHAALDIDAEATQRQMMLLWVREQ